MIQLRNSEPTARKQHKCMFCGGIIEIGEQYQRSTNVFDGVLYDWVNHIMCNKIASKLRMYDDADEGVTEDYFQTRIHDEYAYIMSENHEDLWESKDFVMPTFLEKLNFVIEWYKNKES